jgi:hypothetical protein
VPCEELVRDVQDPRKKAPMHRELLRATAADDPGRPLAQ